MTETKIIALIAFLLMATPAYSGDILVQPSKDGAYQYIYFRDVIVPKDDVKLEQSLKQAAATGKPIVVDLESRGGDVDVSMAMGRSIRRYNAVTYHRKCSSSCVFAFLGGVQRYSINSDKYALIIHRPELGEAQVKNPTAFGQKMLNMLRDYIVEMIGKPDLYDVMMTVPFSDKHALSNKEAVMMNAVTINPIVKAGNKRN